MSIVVEGWKTVRVVMAILLAGCTMQSTVPPTPQETPIPVEVTLTIASPPFVSVEAGIDDADSFGLTADLVMWFSRDGDLYRQDLGEEPVMIERALDGVVDASASLEGLHGETTGLELVVLDGVPHAWDGLFLRPSPIADALQGSFVQLTPAGEDLWIETSVGLYRWDRAGIVEVTVDGEPVTRGFAAGVRDGRPVMWLGTDEAIHAAPASGGAIVESHPVRADGLATDGDGFTWVLVEGGLHQILEGDLVDLDRTGVRSLLANPVDGQVWFGADDGWWRARGLEAQQLTPDAADPLFIDGAGRLWTEAERIAVDRPILLSGLDRSGVLDEQRTLGVHPTDASEVREVTVQLDGNPIVLAADWTFSLDPASLEAGLHDLDITVSWADDDVRTTERSVQVGEAFDITWAEHVEPIHDARCARCHVSGTETILSDPSTWQMQYDRILQQVRSGAMPLADTPLTASELSLVVGWGNGGFLP